MSTQDPAALFQEFRQWLAEPRRTVDELCPAELLLNWARVVWGWKHQKPAITDYTKAAAAKKQRLNNPAYRPVIDEEKLALAGEIWGEIEKWPISNYEDRPIRSLAVLKFLPHLEELDIDSAELADLTPLAGLKKLRKLKLAEAATGGHITKNLSALEGLKHLEVMTLNLRAPWPDLSALGTLPALRRLNYHGNILALCGIPELPAMQVASFAGDHRWSVPVRDMEDFPRMPRVERLVFKGIADLRGAARCIGSVRNAELAGPFSDLTPLAELAQVTSLKLESEIFLDVAPLARMPNLHELVMVRERPFDLAPLSDSTSLREVSVEGCPILQTELAALNAGLLPWDGDFLAPEPRKLAPLQILHVQSKHPDVKRALETPKAPDPRLSVHGDDRALAAAEGRWFAGHLQTRLDALLGKGWGISSSTGSLAAGHEHLDIKRYRDVTRLGEIIETIRGLIAECRYPWQLLISVEPHGDLSEEMEEIRAREAGAGKPWWEREYDAAEERGEYEEFRRKRRELFERFEREHRMRLLEQQGEEIRPEDFSPESVEDELAEDADDYDDEEDEAEIDEALAEELSFVMVLDENYLWLPSHMRAKAEYALGRTAMEWHELPGPVEERPRPHP